MLLLQFSTSHYCRKARLALGYKQIPYQVENLTPGLHILRVKPLTGLSTLPVLLPQRPDKPRAIADSTAIYRYLEAQQPEPSYYPADPILCTQAECWEDWLDESIGTATRFVYYHFRAGAGRALDSSWFSQAIINVVRAQYGIQETAVQRAGDRLQLALRVLAPWQNQPYLIGSSPTIADLTAAALLSPLALIPQYRQQVPWLFARVREIHQLCREPLPPGLVEQ